MVETKNLRTGAEVLLIFLFMASLGVNITDKDEGYIPYGCDSPTVDDMMCYKLSRVNDNGLQRNCYYDRDNSRKYKVCSDGWERLEILDGNIPQDNSECNPLVIAYTDNGKYFCDSIGKEAKCVKDDTLEVNI